MLSQLGRALGRAEDALFQRLRRRKPAGVLERGSLWLLVFSGFLLAGGELPGNVGSLCAVLAVFSLLALFCFAGMLGYRWLMHRVLWTVRNRLVMTYLLMGLAPVVLFGTLAGISAYVFAGQFATDSARSVLNEALVRVHTSSSLSAAMLLDDVVRHPNAPTYELPVIARVRGQSEPGARDAISAWVGRKSLQLTSPRDPGGVEPAVLADSAPPPWLTSGFRGIVAIGGRLYLCSNSMASHESSSLSVIATSPLNQATLAAMAQGIGSISILPGAIDVDASQGQVLTAHNERSADAAFRSEQGGALASAAYFFDARVFFSAPLQVTDWSTGKDVGALLGVVSRPTALYGRLFATSVQIGKLVREVLVAIAVMFGLIDLLAFVMAVRLSRTITHSVAELYNATQQVDHGNFTHRIRVERDDQLAALSRSFNTMTGSLEHLLEQQREKERIQSELEIAHEVQINLFPHSPIQMSHFELHGVCKPARTVSGDYYDFVHAHDGELCLTLGDISGKGISAALLMASLHSAVRAYRSAGEQRGESEQGNGSGRYASPAKLLALLNQHLYSSTQPEKYATLFLACYDSAKRTLTYANGGQLPPLLVSLDGTIRRLDCGGSVVGLLQDLAYEEATIALEPGDLLVAYSDGVTEPENEFGEFGEGRLLDVIRTHRDQPLPTISAQAMRAVHNWIGAGEQPDDITLVLARQL